MIEPKFKVSEALAERIKELRDAGLSQLSIAIEIEHSQATVSVVLANLLRDPDAYKGVTESTREKPDRNAAHVRMATRCGHGFPVYPKALLSRLYALEYAPARQILKVRVCAA